MATNLGSRAIGSTVKIRINGVAENFIVVHQGLPSTRYDNSCNGTWLLMEDIYSTAPWSTNGNSYADSDIYAYLNNTFYNLIDADVRSIVKQVKIPYQKGTGTSGTMATGSNGLSSKVFLLSAYEIGLTTSNNPYIPVDGAKLWYFELGNDSSAAAKRIAKNGNSATNWITRSPFLYNASDVWYIKNDGTEGLWYFDSRNGIRPCIILPKDAILTEDGGLATNNTAPMTPETITVPSSIRLEDTITISWSKSTDADGNLAGYILERSVNSGSHWGQAYQGPATSITLNASQFKGAGTIIFRVKAYDDEGLESDYKVSAQVNVIYNHPPEACPSISVPTGISAGDAIEVSWAAATDTDGNLAGYILERSIDGGNSWTQIYKGTNLKYTDTSVKGWPSVRYRVKAYDSYNTTSDYTVSETRAINNNTAPVISCDASSNLGTKTGGFSISYSVTDADAEDTITVTEQIDGTVKRTFTPIRGGTNSFAVTGDYFQKLSNGAHTLTIIATDGTATTKKEFAFTKQITVATITLASPLIATDEIRVFRLNIAGDIPADADLQVLATNNAKDTSPIWEDAAQAVRGGRNHVFSNYTQVNGWALNFKITVKRGASGIGGMITKVEGAFGSSASGNSGSGSGGGATLEGLSVVDGALCFTIEE